MYILILDDSSARHAEFDRMCAGMSDPPMVTHVSTVKDACKALSATRYDIVCLDHDLDLVDSSENGMEVVDYIIDHLGATHRPEHVGVHSHNATAAVEMVRKLSQAGISTSLEPELFPEGM